MADIKLGNIYAELSLNASGLSATKQKAIQQLEKLDKEGTQIMQQAGAHLTDALKIKLNEIETNKKECIKIIDQLNEEIKTKHEKTLAGIGEMLQRNVTGPLKQFGEQAVQTFSSFEQSMQNTFSVMGASESEMRILTETAKEMGETTRFSASAAASALYSLGSAGQSATEATKSLKGVLQLAGATGADLAYTSETIASTLSQFNLQAGKAGHVADVFAKAISKSQANIGKLSYSMKYVGPVASGLGISLESTTASLMKLYNTGYGGEQAGTYLKNAFQKLASGTEDLKNRLNELGIEYEDVNPQTQNFADILDILKEKNIGVTESIAIFGESAGGAMAKLIEDGGDAIRTMEGVLQASDGASAEMQKIQNASFANTKAELASAFEALQISIGSILAPALDAIAKGFTKILITLNNLPVGLQTFITTLVMVGTALVPLLGVPALITKIKAALMLLNTELLASPIFLCATAIATIGTAIYATYRQTKENTEKMRSEVKKGIEEIKRMQEEAENASVKGKHIEELLNRYEDLKNKTNKTKEEQKEYNETLQRLTEIVPNVITGIDATGQAYIDNIELIKTARMEQLSIEKQQTVAAIEMAKITAKAAETNLINTQKNIKKLEEQRDLYNGYANDLKDYELFMNELIEKYQTENSASIKQKLEYWFRELKIGGMSIHESMYDGNGIEIYNSSVEQDIVKYQRLVTETRKMVLDYYSSLATAKKMEAEDKKDIQELEALQKKKEQIEKELDVEKEKVLKTKAQYVAEEENIVKAELKRREENTRIFSEKFDRTKEELHLRREELKELLNIKSYNTSEGEAFKETDKEIQAIINRIKELNNALETKNKDFTLPAPKEDVTKKSLDEKLQELDTFYSERVAIAKQYGKESYEIEQEWVDLRLKLLTEYVQARKETIDQDINLSEKQKNAEKQKIVDESTGGKKERAFITLKDELSKTNAMMESELGRLKRQYEEKLKQLEEVIAKIKEAKIALASLKTAKDVQDTHQIQIMEKHLGNLEGQAKNLSEDLGKSYVTMDEAQRSHDNFVNQTHTSFATKFAEIKEREQEALRKIQEASKNATPEEKQKLNKQEKEVKGQANQERAVAVIEVIQTVLNVASRVTDIILNAIEKGSLEVSEILDMTVELTNILIEVIPNELAKAILGLVGGLITYSNKFVKFFERRRKKREEEERKRLEEEERQRVELVNKIAGKSAEIYLKHIRMIRKGGEEAKNVFKSIFESMQDKAINDAIGDFGQHRFSLKIIKKGMAEWDQMYYKGILRIVRVNDVMYEYRKAILEGNTDLAELLELELKNEYENYLAKRGLRKDDLESLKRYYDGTFEIIEKAYKKRDYSTLFIDFKEHLRSAVLKRLKETMLDSKLKELIEQWEKRIKYGPGGRNMREIQAELEKLGKDYEKEANRFLQYLGIVESEMDGHLRAWQDMKESIKNALSSSLGEAAYNADWDSFKRAFAGEMKKAIISSAVANEGVKTQVDAIIKRIMKDGKITQEEIEKTTNELKEIYDKLEGELGGIAKVIEGLNGSTVKHEVQGATIQKLSGEDRDWFTEIFKENFKKMAECFRSVMIDLKEIHYAKIIVQSATLNVNTVNIQATDNMSLKDFLAELIEAARNAG